MMTMKSAAILVLCIVTIFLSKGRISAIHECFCNNDCNNDLNDYYDHFLYTLSVMSEAGADSFIVNKHVITIYMPKCSVNSLLRYEIVYDLRLSDIAKEESQQEHEPAKVSPSVDLPVPCFFSLHLRRKSSSFDPAFVHWLDTFPVFSNS